MLLRNVLSILFIFGSTHATTQSGSHDLASYKARYERRPAMYLFGRADYSGAFQKDEQAANTAQTTAYFSWQERRNTDALVSTWLLSGQLAGNFGLTASGLIVDERYNSGYSYLSANWEQYHYYGENRFWGWGGEVGAEAAIYSALGNYRNLEIHLAPAIFKGIGRIEFAEDALLARWMLEDLREAGAVGDFSPDDVTALARTITDIIGNRTFDLRRRRIYELGRLQSTLLEQGLAEGESFALFAILNDNWAFANRGALPHGNRLRYGLAADAYSQWSRSGDYVRNHPSSYGLAFLEYVRARIINNRAGGEWAARLEGGYYQSWRKVNDANWQTDDGGLFAQASLGYTHRWLPSSRTVLAWRNEAAFTWGFPDAAPILTTPFSNKRGSWNSVLNLNYFINYQWSFQLNANAGFIYSEKPHRISFSPGFNFSTNYYFF